MTQTEEEFSKRSRRSTSEIDFLTKAIDKMMQTYLRNQDAVLDHQTEMVESLLHSQNSTEQIDGHFFSMMREIRRGYFNLMEDLETRVVNPMCPSVTPILYGITIGLSLSVSANLVFVFLLYRRSRIRYLLF